GGGQVRPAVAVDVSHSDPEVGPAAREERHGGSESTAPVTEDHYDAVGVDALHRQVGDPVAVGVPGDEAVDVRPAPGIERRGGGGSKTAAAREEHGDEAGLVVGKGEIDLTVTIEVTEGDVVGHGAGRERWDGGTGKSSRSVSMEEDGVAAALVRDH